MSASRSRNELRPKRPRATKKLRTENQETKKVCGQGGWLILEREGEGGERGAAPGL